jgi:chromosome partitioning protein
VLIPVRPSPVDVKAAPAAVDLVRAAGRSAAFVITQARVRAPEIAQTQEALAEHGFAIAPVVIGERAAYVRAITGGEAVTEFEPAG